MEVESDDRFNDQLVASIDGNLSRYHIKGVWN